MSRRRAVPAPAGGALALLLAGCISGEYARATFDEPVDPARLAGLRPGCDDLGRCLAALGAPHRVFEYRVGPDLSAGMALLWVWRAQRGFGIELSSPSDEVRGSVSFDLDGIDLPGCMLWFGPDLRLEACRMGLVGELLAWRRRPAAVPEP